MTPRILIIAGSDSGGGAGIQADIKTVTMLGGHAMTAITAVTAQNTLGVQAVHAVPTDMVMAQIESCVSDIGVDAVKIGMIGSAETANAVADWLETIVAPAEAGAAVDKSIHDATDPCLRRGDVRVVFDPVMVSTSGSTLADASTIAAFERLMAISSVTTPNLPELAALGGEARVQASARAVLVKGGHGAGATLVDRLLDPSGEIASWSDARIETTSTHGTGCTLSSAIALGLAEQRSLTEAVARARVFVRLALREAPGLGGGHGPMGQQNVRLDVGPAMRLNQFVLPHRAYGESVDFYRTLGLTLIVDSPGNEYARFETPGGATLSLHGDDAGVNFECDDLDARVDAARAAGIPFEGPVDQPWGWREAWTFDPAGNRVLLFSAGENRRYPPWRLP